MKTAPVVLQNTSLFVTMTFQIEEQKEKKQQQQEQQQQFSKRKQTNHNHFLFQLFHKTSFFGGGFASGRI